MPVPVYLAANCKEIATFTGRAAVLGLGFLPDGGARIPACPLQGHMAVIDDAVPPLPYPGGMLPAALCSCEKSPAGLRYFDTPESLRQKLAHAAAHGCRCAIGLWQELQPFFPERDG